MEKDVYPAYLESTAIQGRSRCPVQKILFTIVSHDQGFSSYPQFHESYHNSNTWFEARIRRNGEMLDGPRIMTNVHESFKERAHAVLWRSETRGNSKGNETTEWVWQLQVGDAVCTVPFARYPGWYNTVCCAQIDVYTTCLL